jgi:hypothetical protein
MKNTILALGQQQTGHVYIVDLKTCAQDYGWLLSAVLLHQQSFTGKKFKFPQCTSVATLEVKSPALHQQVLSIQQALQDGKRIYAEIEFSQLRLLGQTPDGMPSTAAELVELSHVVVEYRRMEGH